MRDPQTFEIYQEGNNGSGSISPSHIVNNLNSTLMSQSVAAQEASKKGINKEIINHFRFRSGDQMEHNKDRAYATIDGKIAIHGSTQLTQTAVESPSAPFSEQKELNLRNFTKAIIS